MKSNSSTHVPFIVLMILSMAAWGASWVSAKVIAGITSPQILVFWRYMITAFAFLPILLYRKESFRLTRKALFSILASSFFMAAYSQFFFRGLETGLAGAGGVLLTTINPLFTYILTALLFRKKPHNKEIWGVLIGLVGGFFLLRLWHFDSHELIQSGNLYFILGALFWSFLAIFSHEAQKTTSVFLYSFYINGLSSVLMMFFFSMSDAMKIFTFPRYFWLNLLYLSLIATTFATTAYFYSTKKLGASKGSTFIFLVPVFAVLFSFLFLGEIPQWNTLVGGALTIYAVFLIHRKEK